jgi:hypothetical protein
MLSSIAFLAFSSLYRDDAMSTKDTVDVLEIQAQKPFFFFSDFSTES